MNFPSSSIIFLSLRTGNWITRERIHVYTRMLVIAYLLAFSVWYALADGLRDKSGNPIGTDFLNVYTAGIMVAEGRAPQAYDWPLQHEVEKKVTGYDTPYYGWHYPPPFLGVARIAATLPYLTSLSLYLGLGLIAYLLTLRTLAPKHKEASWVIAAFPAAFINIGNGQNGFITTSLLGMGLALLEMHPLLSGCLFGLLVYKPHFFALIPLFLLIEKKWKALGATLLTGAACYLFSYMALGKEIWIAFFNSRDLTQHTVLEAGSTGWEKIQSVFSMVRMAGGDIALAYGIQAFFSIVTLSLAFIIIRKTKSASLRAATLCVTTLLVTPYLLDYDLMILSLPLVFLAKPLIEKTLDAPPYEKTFLALLWLWPFVARSFGTLGLPLTPLLLTLLLGLCYRRALYAHRNNPPCDALP